MSQTHSPFIPNIPEPDGAGVERVAELTRRYVLSPDSKWGLPSELHATDDQMAARASSIVTASGLPVVVREYAADGEQTMIHVFSPTRGCHDHRRSRHHRPDCQVQRS